MVIDRVPIKENIADLPSRGSYHLLKKICAVAVKAKMDTAFYEPTAWEALTLSEGLAGVLCVYEPLDRSEPVYAYAGPFC